jgi:Mg2+ and Co2+ transporter CorA
VTFPTFIVGVYGQNFDSLPGQDLRYGFWVAMVLVALAVLAGVLTFAYFGWIELPRRRSSSKNRADLPD